jgi:hypothetical protein
MAKYASNLGLTKDPKEFFTGEGRFTTAANIPEL